MPTKECKNLHLLPVQVGDKPPQIRMQANPDRVVDMDVQTGVNFVSATTKLSWLNLNASFQDKNLF